MTKPLPVPSLDEQLAAIRRVRPTTKVEAKKRSAELIRLSQIKARAEREAADAAAAQRIMDDANAPVGSADWESWVVESARNIGQFVREEVAPLKQRLDELEGRRLLEDAGTWQERVLYRPGHVVTYKGTIWVCREANSNARPGKSDAWRLMVKSDQK